MNIHSRIFCVFTLGCATALVWPQCAAAVSDEEFNALKGLVTKQGQRIDQLDKTHDQDQKAHEQDQQQIKQLRQQLGETQTAATNAVQKAEAAAQVQAPSGPSATHNFMMVGDAEVQYVKSQGPHGGFVMANFAPIFLFRASNNVLFEAGFDITLQNNAPAGPDLTTNIDLSFATIDYMYNDFLTIVAGDMPLPLGTYSERSAGWLNKVPDDPTPRDLLPGEGVGLQFRGSFPVGETGQMFTYAAYGVNGPGSVDGSGMIDQLDLGGNSGNQSNGVIGNLHNTPTAGGRLGWFYPWDPHYDVELGISGQTGEWDNPGNQNWAAAVVDAAVHISPYFELKGEYVRTWVESDDFGTTEPRGWWLQGGYKLAGLDLDVPYVSNLELVSRYDRITDGFDVDTERTTVGFVYYFTNTLQLEGDYEFIQSDDPAQPNNEVIVQLSYGF